MEFIKLLIEEIKLRDQGKRGKLENLTDVQLICLAYKLKLKVRG